MSDEAGGGTELSGPPPSWLVLPLPASTQFVLILDAAIGWSPRSTGLLGEQRALAQVAA